MSDKIDTEIVTLQIAHTCCECGAKLPTGRVRRCAILAIAVPGGTTGIRIAWCLNCEDARWPREEPRDVERVS